MGENEESPNDDGDDTTGFALGILLAASIGFGAWRGSIGAGVFMFCIVIYIHCTLDELVRLAK